MTAKRIRFRRSPYFIIKGRLFLVLPFFFIIYSFVSFFYLPSCPPCAYRVRKESERPSKLVHTGRGHLDRCNNLVRRAEGGPRQNYLCGCERHFMCTGANCSGARLHRRPFLFFFLIVSFLTSGLLLWLFVG